MGGQVTTSHRTRELERPSGDFADLVFTRMIVFPAVANILSGIIVDGVRGIRGECTIMGGNHNCGHIAITLCRVKHVLPTVTD
jgi:hypothetical protein